MALGLKLITFVIGGISIGAPAAGVYVTMHSKQKLAVSPETRLGVVLISKFGAGPYWIFELVVPSITSTQFADLKEQELT